MKNLIILLALTTALLAAAQTPDQYIAAGTNNLALNDLWGADTNISAALAVSPTNETTRLLKATTRLLVLSHTPAAGNFLVAPGYPATNAPDGSPLLSAFQATNAAPGVISNQGPAGLLFSQTKGIVQPYSSTTQSGIITSVVCNVPPIRGISSYNMFKGSTPGGAATESNIWWAVTNCEHWGLTAHGYNVAKIEMGWYYGRDPVTGHILWVTNWWPDTTNFLQQLHSMGWKYWLTLWDGGTNNQAGPFIPMYGSYANDYRELYYAPQIPAWMTNDVTDLRRWGSDGFYFDTINLEVPDSFNRFMKEGYYQVIKSLYPQMLYVIYTCGFTNTDNYYCQVFPTNITQQYHNRLPQWMVDETDHIDIQPIDWGVQGVWDYLYYSCLMAEKVSPYCNSLKHPFFGSMSAGINEPSKTQVAETCLFHGDLFLGNFGNASFLYTNELVYLTNDAVLNIQRDPAYGNPVRVPCGATNALAYVEDLADGSKIVFVLNNTNIQQTYTIPIDATATNNAYGMPAATNSHGWLVKELWDNSDNYYVNRDPIPLDNVWVTNYLTFTGVTNCTWTNYNSWIFKLTPDDKVSFGGELAASNLVLGLSFDNGLLTDRSIFQYPVHLHSGTYISTNGVGGAGLNFNGNTDFAIGGYNPWPYPGWSYGNYGICGSIGQAFTNGNWTVSMWVKSTNYGNLNLLTLNNDANHVAAECRVVSSNTLTFYVGSDSSTYNYRTHAFAGLNFTDGNWHHFVWTCSDATALTMYVDVTNVYSTNLTVTPPYYGPAGLLLIGANRQFNALGIGTSLDELAIYNRTFTSNDVFQLDRAMNAQLAIGPCKVLPDGQFQLTVSGGRTGQSYLLLASTNLVSWTPISGFVSTNSPLTIFDPDAWKFRYRFYRIGPMSLVPAARLGLISGQTNHSNGFNVVMYGLPGLSYYIEASTNMVDWTTITNFTSTNSSFYFSDPQAENYRQRFYRAVMP